VPARRPRHPAAVYGQFTEGFGPPVLKEAKVLLETLAV
jgi:hypothetical protein